MDIALDIARTMLAGFNKHYRIFREAAAQARGHFERREWDEIRELNRARIDLYDTRVLETVEFLKTEFADSVGEAMWPQIKLNYIGLLYEHKQPECAETFFNSVAAKVLDRRYHSNQYIFSRPAVAAEHIEGKQPTYRCYYPAQTGLKEALTAIFDDFELGVPLADPRRCFKNVLGELKKWLPHPHGPVKQEPNFHIQMLSSLFYRNKAAYAIGRVVNGPHRDLFAVALRHSSQGGLRVDAFVHDKAHLSNMLSVSHAYFMVDMEVPSSWVSFINAALPEKPKSELYTAVGLQKQGKTVFIRDLHQHLKHSADQFIIAPGVRGMVMFVFTLPSYPYVFKVIRDSFEPPKDATRAVVMEKYRLVKRHDRVGRMADTLEYSDVALPLDRFAPNVIEEMKRFIPSSVEFQGDLLVIKHLYIEQRMTPLDIYLREAAEEAAEEKAKASAQSDQEEARLRHGVREFGQTLRDLAAANIFAGDLLPKNFGVNPTGRVLFYDYDEVCYLTECNFRKVPASRFDEDDLRAEPWYSVGSNDIFPEEFQKFLFSGDRPRELFKEMHGELFSPEFWAASQEKTRAGTEVDLYPYPDDIRFKN